MSTSAIMDSADLENEARKERARALVEELRDLNKETAQHEAVTKAMSNIKAKRTYENN